MTYYKLNEEKLEGDDPHASKNDYELARLIHRNVLEEVKEEEIYGKSPVALNTKQQEAEYIVLKKAMQSCACSCAKEYPHSHLVAGKRCECEEGRNTKVNVGGFEYREDIEKLYKQPKPFLDGKKPSEFIKESARKKSPNYQHNKTLSSTETIWDIHDFLDLLVEELKKQGSLK